MCGIMGYVGEKECASYIIGGLKRLEYRGYDSSGIAVTNGTKFQIVKSEGKIKNIESILEKNPLPGKAGIGHTRWATHGKPNSINAHPHRVGNTVLVHNGIIENYEEIKQLLLKKGRTFVSETDSELFGHLVEDQMASGTDFLESVRLSFLKLRGSCTIVSAHDTEPRKIIAIRTGTPLVATQSKSAAGCFVASDPQALLEHSNEIIYLENEDVAICEKDRIQIYNLRSPFKNQKAIERAAVALNWNAASVEKEGFEHYMLKEIHEQPRAVLDTIDGYNDRTSTKVIQNLVNHPKIIHLVACGTAWHACLIGRSILEEATRIPVVVDLGSEYRYRNPIIDENTLVIAVSQSGETADTLAAIREAKSRGATTAAICNVRGSSLAREVDQTFYTNAGPEIGVASTKAFTTQILMFMMLGHGITQIKNERLDLSSLLKIPHLIQLVLANEAKLKEIAKYYLNSTGFLFLGRGLLFPIALEGALKIKEISYVHAEGYPAGELKHGPIAMVDSNVAVIVIAPQDKLYEKNISNLHEVKARGGKIVAFGNEGDTHLEKLSDHFVGLPFHNDWSDTILATVPLQLLAYHVAVLKGTDVDKPRNLAKSVTVE